MQSTFLNPKRHFRFEIVTNFVELRIYTQNRIEAHSIDLRLLDRGDRLEQLIYFLSPNSLIPEINKSDEDINPPFATLKENFQDELALGLRVSADRALQMGEVHTHLVDLGFTQQQADKTVVRLAFLMFADDTDIFSEHGYFTNFLEYEMKEKPENRLSNLIRLFTAVDTPDDAERNRLESGAPYINGGLFSGADTDTYNFHIQDLDDEIIQKLYEISKDDWSKINPIVFGSMYEGAMDSKTRREIGAHYTSEQNIMKVIDKLFLNNLRIQFNRVKNSKNSTVSKLLSFKKSLSQLTFLDPACGSGNFLIVTYREIRKLEHSVIQEILTLTHQKFDTGFGVNDITSYGFNARGRLTSDRMAVSDKTWQPLIGVEVKQFNGIEIGIPYKDDLGVYRYNGYPIDIAKAGMWMMDHLMNREFSNIIAGIPYVRIPLHESANIIQADSLKIDWNNVICAKDLSYILGNPPFIGAKIKKGENPRVRLSEIFPNIKNIDNMDYVVGWFLKSFEMVKRNDLLKIGLVAVSSISKGIQAIRLGKLYQENKISINFAFQTFNWDNNGTNVRVVIVGFNDKSIELDDKILVTEHNKKELIVSHINEYLLDDAWINLSTKTQQISNASEIKLGSLCLDDNNYRISSSEYEKLKYNVQGRGIIQYFHPFFGAYEILNDISPKEYILHLDSEERKKVSNNAIIKDILYRVGVYRESVAKADQYLAEYPWKYKRDRFYNNEILAIPRHSSGPRDILPMRYLAKGTIISDGAYQIQAAPLWLFSILQSSLHTGWLNIVSGRLGESLRYSSNIAYNDFVFINLSENDKSALNDYAKEILNIRKQLFQKGISLAQMYDRNNIPFRLKEVHTKLDTFVDNLYGVTEFTDIGRFHRVLELYNLKK